MSNSVNCSLHDVFLLVDSWYRYEDRQDSEKDRSKVKIEHMIITPKSDRTSEPP